MTQSVTPTHTVVLYDSTTLPPKVRTYVEALAINDGFSPTRRPAFGYGNKLATSWKVFFEGRWRRVYCRIFSNAGTCYFLMRGVEWRILDGTLAPLRVDTINPVE